jgi:hypothetical protein
LSLNKRARTADSSSVARKRLLIAITLAETGGAQSCVAQLLPAVSEHYDVVVAAHGPGPLEAAAREAGAEFVRLRHVRRPIGPVTSQAWSSSSGSSDGCGRTSCT